MWSIERPLYCKKCGNLLTVFSNSASKEYVDAIIRDFATCSRCGRNLDPSQKEYHHEMYFRIKSIIWKLTHPWRLFK